MHIPLRLAPSLFWSQGRGQRLLVTNTQKPYSPESGPAKGVRPRAKQGQKSRFYNPWYSAPGRNHGGKVTLNNINVEQTVQQVAPLLATEQGLLPALKGGLEVLLLVSLLNPLGLNSSNSSKPPSADPFRKKKCRGRPAAGFGPAFGRHVCAVSVRPRRHGPRNRQPIHTIRTGLGYKGYTYAGERLRPCSTRADSSSERAARG